MRSVALALSLLAACGTTDDDDPWAPFSPTLQDRVIGLVRQDAPPADPTNAYAERADAAALGQFLYFDPRLSAGYLRADAQAKDVSCATCHAGDLGLADGLALAVGQAEVTRNAPTVLNTAFNRWFFWDGRADSHWSQALGPLENPLEHGVSREEVVAFVSDEPELAAAYAAVFGQSPAAEADPDRVFVNVGKAIAAYERLLVTGDAPLDTFARAMAAGDTAAMSSALSPEAREGLALFVGEARCHLCHAGPNLTDLEFHNVGLSVEDDGLKDRRDGLAVVLSDPFNGAGAYSDDPAFGARKLANLKAFEADDPDGEHLDGQFKTPNLRAVALTAPYMHDGRFETLAEVLAHYNELPPQSLDGHREETLLPLDLSAADLAALEAFLEEGLAAALPSTSLLTAPDSPTL